jgi:hypothetical protein
MLRAQALRFSSAAAGNGYCPEYGCPNNADGKHLMLPLIDSEAVMEHWETALNSAAS